MAENTDLMKLLGVPEITREIKEESLIPSIPKRELTLKDKYPEIDTEMLEPDMDKVPDMSDVTTKDPTPRPRAGDLDAVKSARMRALLKKAGKGLAKGLPVVGGLMTLSEEAEAGSSIPEALGKAIAEEVSPMPMELITEPAKGIYRDITKSDEDREIERKMSREAILKELARRRDER